MTITKNAQDAVQDLQQQDFFLVLQDPSVAGAEKDTMRTEKLEQFLNTSLNSVGGQDLSGWGAHLEAELRSGVTLPEIIGELKNLRRVEEQIDNVGLGEARRENGYMSWQQKAEAANGTADGQQKMETANVDTAAIDVKPNPVTSETQSAYSIAQSAKASDIAQTVDN